MPDSETHALAAAARAPAGHCNRNPGLRLRAEPRVRVRPMMTRILGQPQAVRATQARTRIPYSEQGQLVLPGPPGCGAAFKFRVGFQAVAAPRSETPAVRVRQSIQTENYCPAPGPNLELYESARPEYYIRVYPSPSRCSHECRLSAFSRPACRPGPAGVSIVHSI
jgi:hypothetical protein